MIVDHPPPPLLRFLSSFYPELPREIGGSEREDPGLSESATDFFHTGSGSTILNTIESIWDLKVRKPYLDRVDREERN